jgi:hypothetical protein
LFLLGPPEQFHSTPETQTEESYVHPEDIEHFSQHEKIEQEEVEKEAKFQGLTVEEVVKSLHDAEAQGKHPLTKRTNHMKIKTLDLRLPQIPNPLVSHHRRNKIATSNTRRPWLHYPNGELVIKAIRHPSQLERNCVRICHIR